MSEQIAEPQSIAQFGYTEEQCVSLLATFGYLCYEELDANVITDYCRRAIDRLIEQFKKKYRIQSLLCAFTDQIQALEYVVSDVLTLRSLQTAAGVQLDGIGEIVGLLRTSLDDAIYRVDLIQQIGFNSASGTPEEIMAYALAISGGSSITYSEIWPAKIQLDVTADPDNIPVNFVQLVQSVAPAGVGVNITVSEAGEDWFAYDAEGGGDDLPNNLGFFEPTEIGGGQYVEEYI